MTRPAFAVLLLDRPLTSLLTLSVASALAFACDAGESSDDDDDGAGGTTAVAGSPATGGTPTAGATAMAGSGGSVAGAPAGGSGGTVSGPSGFGTPMQEGEGLSQDRWAKNAVSRNGVFYYFMANGWGPGFQSQTVQWKGTSFTVQSMQGTQGPSYEPASYPTMFCGVYSDSRSGQCGLPRPVAQITSLRTGWRWQPNGNTGQYNAAYDIWLSNNGDVSGHSSFLMVWLRDPAGQQPAGRVVQSQITVPGVAGAWNLWSGVISGKPCISYVRAEGQDQLEIEFDAMAFVRDAPTRGVQLPGSQILSVAVGFEIWRGPVTNLVSSDFYVDVQ